MTATGIKETTLDFRGQDFYIGLDVHKKQWTVTIRLGGLVLRTFSMDPSAQTLYQYLTRNYPGGQYHSVYEAGFCGFGIHRHLVTLGIDNRVTHAADVPTAHKERTRRNDTVDSRKLARELENGDLTAIHIPSIEQECFRSLVRRRNQVAKSLRQVKCRIKSLLHYYGIEIPDRFGSRCWSRAFLSWLQSVRLTYPPGTLALQLLIEELTEHRARMLAVTRHIRAELREDSRQPLIGHLRTVPGIGPVLAATLYAEIMDMSRFKNLDQLAAWAGLIPSTDSSGEQEGNRGITSRCNRQLRYQIVEAAWKAVRLDPALTQAYQKMCQRMKACQAIIRIAKKLLNRIRSVWLSNKDYVSGVVA